MYLGCVGGELTKRELAKCWERGIAVEGGCYGPGNEIRKAIDGLDDRLRHAFGANGEGYKLFHKLKNDWLTPGPNQEFVKFLNNGLHDAKNGPGPNDEFVKACHAIAGVFHSIGKIHLF
jgi:hypothetical protein